MKSISNRLTKLEQRKGRLNYPSFSESYGLNDPKKYDEWLLENNIGLTQAMIDELNIKHISDMYQ